MLDGLRVVVTGVCGSLGRATAEKARQSGAYVIGLDIVDTLRNATMTAVPMQLAQGGGTIVNIGALIPVRGLS